MNVSVPQESTMDCPPNFQQLSSNEIHVCRMRVAVVWSMILQCILLMIFTLLINIDVLHPLTWVVNGFYVFLSASVWLKLLVLIVIIFIQGEVCKKDYVIGPSYHPTRFQKIKNFFTLRNLLLLVLNIIIGITIFWVYSSTFGKSYQSLTKKCKENLPIGNPQNCLVEDKVFLLLGGFWLGLYYFANDYMFGSRNLSFPLIQQYKIYRVKAALKENIKQSVKDSIIPTAVYLVLYYFYGGFIRFRIMELLSCQLDKEPIDSVKGLFNVQLILSLWLLSSIFIVALHMMELLFNVYLTEHCLFPVTTDLLPPGNFLSLIQSLKMTTVPIIHHLGYLDLFTLSTKNPSRREEIFTLSLPGGHPHSWNGIFKECLSLINKFSSDLNQALQQAANPEKEGTKPIVDPKVIGFHFHAHRPNMRQLSSPLSNKDIANIRPEGYQSVVEVAFTNLQRWLKLKLDLICKKPYIAYFIAESPDSCINHILCQSQPVIWAVQSLAFLSAASLSEDRYGIVQRDLSDIIVAIMNLKQVLDKLFKQNLIVKKSFANEPIDVQMKYLLRSSVKRSLYKLAITFGPYTRDLRLPSDVEIQLNSFIEFKEVF